MKKKVLSFIMACCMMLSCVGVASASTVEDVRTPVPVVLDQGVSPRAVSAPTANAPASWYGSAHYWTATYYTYSSYWFTTSNPLGLVAEIWAKAPFHVDFITKNGQKGSLNAVYDSRLGQYSVVASMENPNLPFYMVIYNDSSTTIASDAGYIVYVPLDRD